MSPENVAAWEAYYAQKAPPVGQEYDPNQYQQEAAPGYVESPYPPHPHPAQRPQSYAAGNLRDGVTQAMGRMSVHGQ